MNYEQICAAAADESHYLKDRDCLKIYIGAQADNGTAIGVSGFFQEEIDKHGIKARVIVTGSFGYYDLEPLVLVEKPGQAVVLYHNVTPETAAVLVNDYLIGNNPRPDMALGLLGDNKIASIPNISDLPLFNLQNRIALRNCGYLDPQNINHYILSGQGYRGLAKALAMSRREVIEELKKFGLRGRGGAGYLAADKWQTCHDTEGDEKYVICNAVDADPQALTARLLLESDPHSILEGVLIGAYAVGAEKGIICVNAEYPTAIKRLEKALEQMREYGLLGNDILGSTLSCEIEIKGVPTSLVAGEETALLRFLEGKQAMPYIRPPYPAVSGFMGKATLVNNLETMANVAAIFQNGWEWYAASGTDRSRGTKVVTLAGDMVHEYTVEVPFGATLQSIVTDIGGSVSNGKNVKAVQFGGPTGAYFSAESLDIPVDYETIAEAGSIVGSGTIAVFGSDSCAVEMTRDAISYLHSQSCGKCVFGREGSYQMSDILQDIAEYRGTSQDLDLLVELGEGMREGCICNLGRTAPNPVLSSIKLFHADYDAHIKEKKCPVNGKAPISQVD
jgi:NADH-quinone oxidoreductase subunit F